jgi:pimeloyl-ACP methyl ester carboxylesterase
MTTPNVYAPSTEVLYLDTRVSQYPVVWNHTLEADVQYLVRASGTWSAWHAYTWSSYCGQPEDFPAVPSPGVQNGKVGVDAAYVFAAPASFSPCGKPGGPPWINRKFEISVDGGATWFSGEPIDSSYHPSHIYEYAIVGQGFPVQFRLLDSPNSDNYGVLTIQVEPLFSISGTVRDQNGSSVLGVTVSAGNGHTATTNASGIYTLTGLITGTYTIIPSKSGYSFSPASRTVSVPPDATGVDFVGTPPPPPSGKPVVVLVHGWQGLSLSGHSCSEGITSYPDNQNFRIDNAEDMPDWLHGSFEVWSAHLDSSIWGTPSLDENAKCLAKQLAVVRNRAPDHKVTIIAHSMGGLVARAYMESSLYQGDVNRLITLGSPHGGLNFAVLKWLKPDLARDLCTLPTTRATCEWSTERILFFNQQHHVIPGVEYDLLGGDLTPWGLGTFLWPTDGPNDGVVGQASATGYYFNPLRIGGNPRALSGDNVTPFGTHEGHAHFPTLKPSYFDISQGKSYSEAYDCIRHLLGSPEGSCTAIDPGKLHLAVTTPTITQFNTELSGHLAAGEVISHVIPVDTSGASLFHLSYVTGTVAFTLTSPTGTVINPAYAIAHGDVVTYTASAPIEAMAGQVNYLFSSTEAGLWTLHLAADAATDYLAQVGLETPRTLSVTVSADTYNAGDTAFFTSTLSGPNGGIAGAIVTATLRRSDAVTDTLLLTDQGDGTYTASYTVPNAPAYVMMTVQAAGSDGGTPFTRQVDRILAIASQVTQLSNSYADRAVDSDGDGRYEALALDLGVTAAQAGDYTISAKLTSGGQTVANAVTYTTLTTGTQTVTLRYDGDAIRASTLDGPYTVTDLMITDLQNGAIPSVTAADVWTTAAYEWADFGTCRALTVMISPPGGGMVATNPAPDCSGGTKFASGTTITLTAVAKVGYQFDYWIGVVPSTTNPISLTLADDRVLTATFSLAPTPTITPTPVQRRLYLPLVVKG